jgi:hypothetical protein
MSDLSDLEIQRALGRLEEAVKQLTKELSESRAVLLSSAADIEIRLSELERFKVYTVAFATGSSATIVALGALLWRLLTLVKM